MVGFWIRGAQGAVKGVKALSKMKGQKTVGQVKSDAAKSKLKMAKDKLEQTFKKSDQALGKLKKMFSLTISKICVRVMPTRTSTALLALMTGLTSLS